MPKVSLKENDNIFTYEAEEDEIIYHALERQGKKLPHGCLAGSCGSCRMIVLEGEDNLRDPGHIESDTVRHLKETYTEKHGEEFDLMGPVPETCYSGFWTYCATL